MNDFLIGLGVRDITPASSLALWGYSDRQGPANGVLDPLMAVSYTHLTLPTIYSV